MEINDSSRKILLVLLKQCTIQHTVTSISQAIHMTRPGVFKIIKSLEQEKLINIMRIGKGRTSTTIIKINWKNPLIDKVLNLFLATEANEHERWQNTFRTIENLTEFSIIFGSILHDQKSANDIDLLCITKKEKFIPLEQALQEIQKTQVKKIHAIQLTKKGFNDEIKKGNAAYIDAIKKGVILFGGDAFVIFLKENTK